MRSDIVKVQKKQQHSEIDARGGIADRTHSMVKASLTEPCLVPQRLPATLGCRMVCSWMNSAKSSCSAVIMLGRWALPFCQLSVAAMCHVQVLRKDALLQHTGDDVDQRHKDFLCRQ